MTKTRILFVCLGNICRSPMAESIFIHKLREQGLTSEFEADSAGTGDWHVGEAPDHRTIKALADRGIPFASHARQVKTSDFVEFDYIIAMDDANMSDLKKWQGSAPEKIKLMQTFDAKSPHREVPDPYYGDQADFEKVFEMLDASTQGLIGVLKSR